MKSSRITLDLPESLLKSLKQSKLGQNCSSVNEAVRACIRNTVGIESPPLDGPDKKAGNEK